MAAQRVEIPEVVLSTSGTPVAGASVQVNIHGGGAATIYQAESGGTTISNPIITTDEGRIEGWVTEGSYDLVVSGTGLTTYTQYFEAVKGANTAGVLSTATGDLVYASSANALARLPIGSTGQVLGIAAGLPAWSSGATTYRKTTAKAVTNTVTETDLLNGEISIGAGLLGTTGALILTAQGDWIQNSGADKDLPRFKLKLGATPTVVLDTSVIGTAIAGNSASRFGWRIVCEIMNLGATNSQWSNLMLHITSASGAAAAATAGAFATGEGVYATLIKSATAAAGVAIAEGGNTSTIDTTGVMNVILSVINPTATATCETKLYWALVQVI